ncbi:hypothetical protein Ahy_B08g091412 [Arachis hypogaea]|uniref:Uncharacterized protein n=1 Tax=Arachis hypogaea TaxID=3818 RepID=A0A444Y255_ARAHY|nr:hypothetical protein Ahy_B08g091412 [Arachis hypogaea]
MRRKLLNIHIPNLAHLAERVRQVEILKKEKEKYNNDERKLKSKSFSRKEKVSYVAMESSDEEFDLKAEDDLVELKKGPPYGLIQEAIMEGRLKFDDRKKETKVNSDPFDSEACFAEPYFGMNMVGMSYDFDVALGKFESDVRSIYPRVGNGLLDFLVQQKLKDQDVFLCRQCNAIFDAEAAAIFEKEKMKKELALKEEQARQKHPIQ